MDAARAEKIKFVSAAKQLAAKLVERQKGINNAQAVHIYYHEPGFKIFTHGQHDVRYKELEKKYRDINEYGVEARKGFEKFLEAQSDPVALSKISSDDIALFRRVANEDTSRYELWQYLGQTSPSDGPVGQRQLGWLDCRDEKEKYWRAQILLDMHSNLSRALWDHLTLGSVV
ncbi:MAG: hypothetical protein LQ339_001159 [Xanthoria mediterranea]|nr:MAG: hypothetical protein LQ339_001159 [Xanthoria mediterranea]